MIVAAEIYSFFGRALCFLSLMDTFEKVGLIWFNTYKTEFSKFSIVPIKSYLTPAKR